MSFSSSRLLFVSFTLLSPLACSSDPTDSESDNSPAAGGSSTGAGGNVGSGGVVEAAGGALTPGVGGETGIGGSSSIGGSAAGGATTSGGAPSDGGSDAGAGGDIAAGGSPDGAGGMMEGSGGETSGATPLFFDDFEGASIGSDWTQNINGNGSFSLDTSVFKNGTQSVKIAGNGFHTMLQLDAASFPTSEQKIYVASWFRVGIEVTQAHYIWVEAGLEQNDQHEVRVGANLGFLQTNQFQNGEIDLREPGVTIAKDTWYCLEFALDSANHEVEVWLDDVFMENISTTDWVQNDPADGGAQPGSPMTDWAPPVEALRFGAELQGHDIWFDDIAVGTEKLGCQ